MKHLMPVGFLLICAGVAHSQNAQNPVKPSPQPTLIADANPSIRNTITVKVPRELKVERAINTLSVTAEPREATKIDAGSKMITGIRCEVFVYPKGEPRPAQPHVSLASGTDFSFFRDLSVTKLDGIPEPGKTYVVEASLVIFETDIFLQDGKWDPTASKNYKVLWTRTLKQIVPP